MPPEKKVGGLTRERVGDASFRMCVGGAGAASRSPEGAAQPGGRSQKRRARREAALDRLERAGELDGRSRGGRERRAAAAGEVDEQPATSSSIA